MSRHRVVITLTDAELSSLVRHARTMQLKTATAAKSVLLQGLAAVMTDDDLKEVVYGGSVLQNWKRKVAKAPVD